jgi:hypothetical protein
MNRTRREGVDATWLMRHVFNPAARRAPWFQEEHKTRRENRLEGRKRTTLRERRSTSLPRSRTRLFFRHILDIGGLIEGDHSGEDKARLRTDVAMIEVARKRPASTRLVTSRARLTRTASRPSSTRTRPGHMTSLPPRTRRLRTAARRAAPEATNRPAETIHMPITQTTAQVRNVRRLRVVRRAAFFFYEPADVKDVVRKAGEG